MENMNIRVDVIRHGNFREPSICCVRDLVTRDIYGQVTLPAGSFTDPAELEGLIKQCRAFVQERYCN